MLDTVQFGHTLKSHGFDLFSGVPCSFLKPLINFAQNEADYLAATNEGDAVAICHGAHLGGKKSVFLCQNSGLTNATSPLISLSAPFQIPLVGFVSLRGEPTLNDEPQHRLMGAVTTAFLDNMNIEWDYLHTTLDKAKQQIEHAHQLYESNKSFFFVVKKGTFQQVGLKPKVHPPKVEAQHMPRMGNPAYPNRADVLSVIIKHRSAETICLSTTGYTSRELCQLGDSPNNLYMVGSMGCINPLALGLARARPDKNIIAIDGDGALLMRLGAMATNGYYHPHNMLHLLLDNGTYESTGGQATVSHQINFTQVAHALQYTQSIYAHNVAELEHIIHHWQRSPTLTFVHIHIAEGTLAGLKRPDMQPAAVKQRLIDSLSEKSLA